VSETDRRYWESHWWRSEVLQPGTISNKTTMSEVH
jgi:hypothetical protein